jgi:hypothetical protein
MTDPPPFSPGNMRAAAARLEDEAAMLSGITDITQIGSQLTPLQNHLTTLLTRLVEIYPPVPVHSLYLSVYTDISYLIPWLDGLRNYPKRTLAERTAADLQKANIVQTLHTIASELRELAVLLEQP